MSVLLSRREAWSLVPIVFLALSLAGCGGGGEGAATAGSGDGTTASTGSVALLLTDNPIDLNTVSQINATIAKAELIGDDDNKVTIFSGPPVTKNLLALRNGSVPLAFSADVPIGTYCKIRLTLTRPDDAPMGEGLEVVFADPAGETAYPNVPGNGKFDFVVQGCFDVFPGATVQLMADLDMEKSLLLVEAGKSGRINFRPVGFAKALTQDFTGRLVRLHGEIKVITDDGNEVLLCNALPMYRDDDHDGDDDDYDSDDEDRRGCVTLNIDRGSTAVFNNLNEQGGVAVPVPAILRADGQPATVVGKVVLSNTEPPQDVDIPDGHLPPPGACKIWYPDREDAQQPPPASCEDLEDDVPAGAVMVDHQGEIEIDHRSKLSVDALVVELGRFIEELSGAVENGASDMRFTMIPDRDIGVENPLQVELQPSVPDELINGTKILTKEGDELSYDVLTPDRRVMADGVLIEGAPTFLRSALVIVGDLAEDTQRLSGTVTRVAGDGSSFLVVTEEPTCGLTDVVVMTDAGTSRFTVTVTETSTASSEGASIEPGDVVDVYGSCQSDGSYAAQSVVEIDDQRAL
jgi:hypothetical protein